MDGIFSSQNWLGWKCRGQRPWLRNADEQCDLQPRVLQRGASNLYFPLQSSALSIPPWSDKLQEALGGYWHSIVETEPKDRAVFIRILADGPLKSVLEELNLNNEELAKQIDKRVKRYNDDSILDIRLEEYRQLVSGESTKHGHEFETRNVPTPDSLTPYFNRIVRVVRLREVMCIRGFSRINPPSGDENDPKISHLSIDKMEWLPAIEVRGEGIFLEFNSKNLQEWEMQEEVRKRAASINESWIKEWRNKYGKGDPKPVITPRYLLVHTWAHALMRQLTLECGYSSASLRERLYIADDENPMAGVLIYTATSDSDGTLGGLQRQGDAEKIAHTVRAAVKSMEWCSSDPLCIQGMVASPDNYSLAACHACCLAPETSCEEFNRFLDRAMIVGTPDSIETGYFSSLLKED
jgi:hypothetical protein